MLAKRNFSLLFTGGYLNLLRGLWVCSDSVLHSDPGKNGLSPVKHHKELVYLDGLLFLLGAWGNGIAQCPWEDPGCLGRTSGSVFQAAPLQSLVLWNGSWSPWALGESFWNWSTVLGTDKELWTMKLEMSFPGGSDDKESACFAEDPGLIPEWERSLAKGNGYLFQYACLENSMDRGAWWATVHGVTKSRIWLSD